MTLAALIPNWFVTLFYLVLFAAAAEDAWRMRISNIWPILLLVGVFAAALLIGPNRGLWINLGWFAGALAVGTVLFSAQLLGGGDVKLLAACLAWFNWTHGWKALVAIAIAGGIVALVLIGLRLAIGRRDARWPVLRPRGGIPYGIAIAAGTAAMTHFLR
ncbi:MAG: prepilin peptidase [Sphingomicrobium sp.]